MSQREKKNLITLILPAVLLAQREIYRISFCINSQVLYSILFEFHHNLLNQLVLEIVRAKHSH